MRGKKALAPVEVAVRETVGYVRVSSEEQAREGVSLAAQEARLKAFAVATNRDLGKVIIDDGQSAKTLARPGLREILDGVKRGRIGSLIVLKLDRLTRSVRDLGTLLDLFSRYDCDLVSVSESLDTASAAGRLMTNVLGSVAQWEREAIGERTAFALEHKRRLHAVYSPEPFGWTRVGDSLIAHPQEQAALERAKVMAASGATLRQIGEEFVRLGVAPKRGGKKWHAACVRSILRSRATKELLAV